MTTTPVQPADRSRVTLRSPGDLLAVIPYLLGFHPADSVVLVAFRDGRAVFAARTDLPGPATGTAADLAGEILDVAARQQPAAVVLVGYGPAGAVDPLLRTAEQAAGGRALTVQDVLRVEHGRWWSYICEDPGCCPPGGTPIDLATHEISATCTLAGLPALPERAALAERVAPVSGPARDRMTRATERAEQRFAGRLAGMTGPELRAAVLAEGSTAVTTAIERYAAGGVLDDDELAWLSLLLVVIPVRDLAWQAIAKTEPHLRLWTDATRRVDQALVAAPASLLAFTAWRAGNGALAGLALDRALAEEPDYSMALLLAEGLRQGLPPSLLDGWGKPQPPADLAPDPRREDEHPGPPQPSGRRLSAPGREVPLAGGGGDHAARRRGGRRRRT